MDELCGVCRYPIPLCKCVDLGEWMKDNNTVSEDIKQSKGKTPLGNLLHFKHALEQVSKVREFGNKKYPDANSYKSIPTEMLLDATFRHLFKDGKDDESGIDHIYHAVVNLLMIAEKERL